MKNENKKTLVDKLESMITMLEKHENEQPKEKQPLILLDEEQMNEYKKYEKKMKKNGVEITPELQYSWFMNHVLAESIQQKNK